jgi:hypothetical protein
MLIENTFLSIIFAYFNISKNVSFPDVQWLGANPSIPSYLGSEKAEELKTERNENSLRH